MSQTVAEIVAGITVPGWDPASAVQLATTRAAQAHIDRNLDQRRTWTFVALALVAAADNPNVRVSLVLRDLEKLEAARGPALAEDAPATA